MRTGCRGPGGVPRPRWLRASQGWMTQASWVWLAGPSELFPGFYDTVGQGARHTCQRCGPLDIGLF